MRRALLALSLLLSASRAAAQEPADTAAIRPVVPSSGVEYVLDESLVSAEPSGHTTEALSHLVNNPLDLNRASVPELRAIPMLSPFLARKITSYRTEHGPFTTVDELADVEDLDPKTLQIIRPFLTVEPPESASKSTPHPTLPDLDTVLSNLDTEFIQRFTRKLDLGRGFNQEGSSTSFHGSPERLTSRLQLDYNQQVQASVTLDKDPGEPLTWAPESKIYGFDHIAGNVRLQDVGRIETLVLGNYTPQFGQGVALWEGLSFGKGRDPVSPLVRNGRGIVPFQSAMEMGYFRGAGVRVAVTPNLSTTGFVSSRQRDATVDSSLESSQMASEGTAARSLSSSGLHRTTSELQRKGVFGTTTVGGALTYHTPRLHLGTVGYHSSFDRPLRPRNQPYRRFDLSGAATSVLSVFGTLHLDQYLLFGEAARAQNDSYGLLAGAALNPEDHLEALILARRFPPAFPSLYSSSIGERTTPKNEYGVYTGLRVRVAKRWRVGTYVDQYWFPWLRFAVPRPSRGLDTRLLLEYDPRPWLSSNLQLRYEREETGTIRSDAGSRPLNTLEQEYRHRARWSTEYAFSDDFHLRTRVQLSRYSTETKPAAYGLVLSQGFRVNLHSSVRLDARFALFDTDDFETRIYTYEHDLLYSFSVPALFDRGQRSYVLVRVNPVPALTIESKYSLTWYPHRRTIGSGLNATTGNRIREVRLQIRWRM